MLPLLVHEYSYFVPHLALMCNMQSFLGIYEMDKIDACCLMLAIDAAHYVYNFISHTHAAPENWPRVPLHILERVAYTIVKSPQRKTIVRTNL